MKKQWISLSTLLFAAVLMIAINGCKKDDDPTALTLKTLVSGTIDLNGATPPNNVPSNPTITATFSTAVDVATATSTNISLMDYANATIPVTITASGSTITIVPTEALASGALHTLSFGAGLKSTEGEVLGTAVVRTFTTEGFFSPAGMVAYWNFDADANDLVGSFNPTAEIAMTYTASRKTAAGNAATFNGTTSLIEIPNGDQLIDTHDYTISLWVKTNSADKTNGHFVLGLAGWNGIQLEIFGGYDGAKFAVQYELADGTGASEDMWFPALATDNTTGGWQGWDFAKSLTADEMTALLKDNWLQVIYTYNSAERKGILYYNGEKMKSFDFDLWPDGDAKRGVVGLKYSGNPAGNLLALGFIQSREDRTISDDWANYALPENNHFKGQLDDIRIFHKVLTPAEILLMYNSEK